MPFKSVKQRRYMHAKHPKIAQRWEAEAKVSKMSAKDAGWLKPVVAGTIAGGLANQFPRVQDIERDRRRKKKGVVKKMLVTSDDPNFNTEAAQKTFDLIMKMDDDTAEMYSVILVGELYERDIEKNLGTLQRHLNDVISKQLESVKQAHLRLVAKGMDADQAVAYAQALAMFDGAISKAKNPYEHGYHFKESDFRRDPSTGRFQMKVSQRQTQELKPKMAQAILGTETPDRVGDKELSPEDRIRFQDEYRQLSDFLGSVSQSAGGSGNQQVLLQFKDKKTGETFAQAHTGRTPPRDLLADPDTRLEGAIAKPETLTTGGAAFGLATAMGGSMSPQQVVTANAAGAGAGTFAEQWLKAGEGDRASNARLYGRTAAAGQFLGQVGPPGSKTQLAGKVAQIVGQAGPQAEMVLGPTTRKTAYRYRGTEKTPERGMVRAYAQGVNQAKMYEAIPELEHGVREPRRAGKPGAQPTAHQMALARAERENRGPTWDERELGRRAVVDHLRAKMPQKSLYDLQLAAGNTPPSEGVIINSEGQLASQAIGYGDDHYLPFNLKHLKALKGGEYIRTRSVGGLTSEDIYTGLISGARQVTVTSRSGTYTMTFEPDFRGGRRHSDKARRMTRRYEQLLDAVQSQQVDRIDIDPEMRLQIENEVKEEMSGPGWRRSDIQDAVKERIDEFKENPYITEQDEKRAELIINARASGASEPERAKIRAQVMDDLMDQKETKFRLNSAGYKAALDALQEQFPYYISKPRWTPPKDAEKKIDTTLDRGYVEPGRNRPTAAAAGLFGAHTRSQHAGKGNKYSAAEADYQGANGGRGRLQLIEGGPEAPTGGAGSSVRDVHEARAEKAAIQALEYKATEVGAKIQQSAIGTLNLEDQKGFAEQLAYTSAEMKDPTKQARFKQFVDSYLNDPNVRTAIGPVNADRMLREYQSATGFRDRKPFDRSTAALWTPQPPTFDGPAYRPGASEQKVNKELDRVDAASRASVTQGIPNSHLLDTELEGEHRTLANMQELLTDSPGIALNNSDLERLNVDTSSPGLGGGVMRDPGKITDRMENLQKTRALLANLTEDQRAARRSGSPENRSLTVHNPTPPASASPTARAKGMAASMKYLARSGKADDEVAAERVSDLADVLSAEADAGLLTGQDWLNDFKQRHQQDWDVLVNVESRIDPKRAITGSS